MTESDDGYADYLALISNVNSMAAVFAGFIITILTLLLTQLPLSSLIQLPIQIILLFLALLFHFWVFQVGVNIMGAFFTVRTLPASVKTSARSIPIFLIAYWAMGMTMPLLFNIFTLNLLAIITAIFWMLFFIVSLLAQHEPLKEYRKARQAHRAED